MKINWFGVFIFILTICLGVFVYKVGSNDFNMRKDFKSDCAETTLYAIGNRGRKIRIYDCGENYENRK